MRFLAATLLLALEANNRSALLERRKDGEPGVVGIPK